MPFFTRKNKKPLGIYVHIPFCRSKCQYCDFYSQACPEKADIHRYIKAVCAHIKETGPQAPGYRVDTVYFGGGTPALAANRLGEIISAINEHFIITEGIGLELHPENVTPETLNILKDAGVTKISIGIQSFQNKYQNIFQMKLHSLYNL